MIKNISIKSKVTLLSTIPMVLAIVILSYLFVSERINDADTALSNKGMTIVNQLAPAIEFGLFSENIEHLRKNAEITLQDIDVYSINITNKDNKSVYQHIKPDIDISDNESLTYKKKIYIHSLEFDELNHTALSTNANNTETKNLLGEVEIKVSTHATKQAQNEIIKHSIIVTVLFILFTTTLAIYISHGITEPILNLTRVMNSIKNGIFTQNFSTRSSGEIAILESGVKEMAVSLIEARKRDKENAEQTLFIEKTKAQITLESIGEGVLTTNKHGHITYMNPAAEKLLKCRNADSEGLPLSKIFRVKLTPQSAEFTYPYIRALTNGNEITHDSPLTLIRSDNSEILIRDTTTPIFDRSGEITGVVLVFQNFTSMHNISDKIIQQAAHDQLTGLLTRHEFESQIKNTLNISSPSTVHSLCFFDLDNFKLINDNCGYYAGDHLLSLIAKEIQGLIRKYDLITRFGSDEFAVFFRDCSNEKATRLANEIKNAIHNINFSWDSQVFTISVSVGTVSLETDKIDVSEFIMHAHSACIESKAKGGDQVNYFSPDDIAQGKDSSAVWHNKIKDAIKNNSLVILCQKIKSVNKLNNKSNENHYELFLGLRDNNEILLSRDFLPYAEKFRMMQDIDRWVINATLELLEKYPIAANKIDVNLNLSGQALTDDNIMEYIVELIDKKGLSPNNITFELSETSVISNHAYTSHFVDKLKRVGFQFSLDNFGNGLCSLSYLKRMPVNKLKISGELVQSVIDDPVNLSIINSINHVCHTLGITTIAQMVETHEILEVIGTTDTDYVQGYAIQQHQVFEDVLKNI